ncbi:hypothetical protein CRUP_013456 [Coryphaenoides rupestris]|nr:hypothetical protein CRUP_013456 [Coryphaenoides rupestris]
MTYPKELRYYYEFIQKVLLQMDEPYAFSIVFGKDNTAPCWMSARNCIGRNPEAFKYNSVSRQSWEVKGHNNKGCNCKQSSCLKNYCECYKVDKIASNCETPVLRCRPGFALNVDFSDTLWLNKNLQQWTKARNDNFH